MDSGYNEVSRSMRVALPVAGIVLFLLAWQLLAQYAIADATLLPTPVEIAVTLDSWVRGGGFLDHFLATLYGTVGGLIIGATLGVAAGILVGEVRLLDRAFYPMALALQAMPMVAIAPLVIVWFGIGLPSKVALVAIGTFFVMFINTVAGMHAAPTELLDMAKAFGGGRWRVVAAVKIRSALDYIFSGLEVCAALSFILCVVGEFLAATAGLGYYIRAASFDINAAGMFAAITVLAVMASLLAVLVRYSHHRAVFWKYRKT